ncbi:PaaI family thioesterase [Rhodococcus sp. IEGM 1381]|uniref:PaaI family thioesterase n=1 Tax=Rhodococcus sp. IEGM 1381 TaxID=3047085 RepID=UPI0024B80FEE|nr:PaaI family thioesterase [Rhodococcus sp. IEGM 1381]MDI9894437.1 PaaI family thioesterase [Rhodococcus sp. IEGM 1381]
MTGNAVPTQSASTDQSEWVTNRVDPTEAVLQMADATRSFAEAQLRAEIDDELADRVTSTLRELQALLAPSVPEESPGARFGFGGPLRNDWGNAVVGTRNPVAAPAHMERHPHGCARSSFTASCLYEGAPNQLHGGFCAMVLDQALCEAAAAGGRAGVTVYLNVSYHRVARIGRLDVEARVERVEGRKSFVRGHIIDESGEICSSAEALVIIPRVHS